MPKLKAKAQSYPLLLLQVGLVVKVLHLGSVFIPLLCAFKSLFVMGMRLRFSAEAAGRNKDTRRRLDGYINQDEAVRGPDSFRR